MDWLKKLRGWLFESRGGAASWVPGEHSQLECFQRFHEPFFSSRKDAESYVNRELAQAVPEGWAVCRLPDQHLTWTIEKKGSTEDYSVRISKGLDVVILGYGNSSAGLFGLHHALHTALVIDSVMLREFNLGRCLSFLFANHKPNEWGLT